MTDAYVVGVDMIKFGRFPDRTVPEIGSEAALMALMYGTRDQMQAVTLPNSGSLYSYSIVHRSFPGIDVPYISAIVDLDDGTAIKGNLINVEPDPEKIEFGMPVEVVYDDALGRKDKDGNSYIAYFFQPQSN